MSLNLSRTQNLNNGNLTYTAPSLRFTRSQASVLETVSGSSVTGRRNWYDDIYFSYNGNLLNKGSRTATADTGGTYITEESQGIEHRITLNSPQKILSHFNITPSKPLEERFNRIAFRLRWNRWNGQKIAQMIVEEIA